MISILKAQETDVAFLSEVGKKTFVEAHGHSAPKADIESYINEKYAIELIKAELSDPQISYHIIYLNGIPAGFSKISFDTRNANIPLEKVSKLDRIYLLKEFHGFQLAYELFQFNRQLSLEKNQKGMWLFVWVENQKAIAFYKKLGFQIIANYDFQISPTHSNPNHQMLLVY